MEAGRFLMMVTGWVVRLLMDVHRAVVWFSVGVVLVVVKVEGDV